MLKKKIIKKKRTLIFSCLIMVMFMTLLFSSCSSTNPPKNSSTPTNSAQNNEENSALKSLKLENQEKGTLAVIKNFPDEETLKKVPQLTTLKFDDESETLLLLPVHNGVTIEIKNITWDNEELIETGTAYKVDSTEDGYGLFLTAIRPEGPPFYKIVVSSSEGKGEYLISYNGKDGTPELETLSINGK